MIRFLLRWAINAVALYVAVMLVNTQIIIGGITLQNNTWQAYIWMALIFGLVNALIKPLVGFLTCLLNLLTLGLFTLVINTLMFYLAGWIGTFFGVGYTVNNFWAAFVAAVIVTVVSFVLNLFLGGERRPRRPRRKKD